MALEVRSTTAVTCSHGAHQSNSLASVITMIEHRRFSVCTSQNEPKGKIFFFSLAVVLGLNSSVFHHLIQRLWKIHGDKWPDIGDAIELISRSLTAIVLGALLFYLNLRGDPKNTKQSVAVVTVYPCLGAQLSNEILDHKLTTTTQTGKNRKFLPQDKILDCIVYEVILSHMVKNVIAFRIQKSTNDEEEEDLQLVPAFPGTEMTYQECLYMRQQIRQALGLGK